MSLLSLRALTKSFSYSVLCSLLPDCSDGPGGGGGVLSLLAPSSRCSPLGGVRDFSAEPSLLRVTGGRPLLGVQQLICQPGHLRLPVRELPEGLQAGVQMPDRNQ